MELIQTNNELLNGLIIISTPKNPINIAIQIFNETFSWRKTADNATTMTGVKDPILWTSAKDK